MRLMVFLSLVVTLVACTNGDLARVQATNYEINQRIQYKRDDGDYWQTPAETYALGTGDCEDYAIMKADLLSHLAPVLLVVHSHGDTWHAILRVTVRGKWWYLDNNYDEIYDDNFRDMRYPVIAYTVPLED